jgi:two-component system, chemotaxis family, chemotaxis protein CheY
LTQAGPHNSSVPVLVVDDEPDLLDVMRFVLESEGFGVETARNGKEALDRMLDRIRAGRAPGLVLLDLMMPVMNGWTFLDEISKTPVLKEIPVVVLTASRAEGVPGAVEVLHKPVDLGLLIQTVERHARGAT